MRDARRPDTAFWVAPDSVAGERLRLDLAESRHLLRVFRAAPGTRFEAIDGAGTVYECELVGVENHHAIARILGQERERGELPSSIALLVGLPDSGPAEAIVEHAVPLGARLIDLVSCARSGRPALTAARLERLERIAIAATKQSRRARLCEVRSSPALEPALAKLGTGPRYVADPDGKRFQSGEELRGQVSVTLAVGPPGGFDEREDASLRDGGFQRISLGPSRLRTETAAIALLVAIRNALL